VSHRPSIAIATRRWGHLWPLAAGTVATPGFDLRVDMLDPLPDLAADECYHGAEVSLSRYALRRAAGDDRLVGVPAFLMRGFRHRCILVRRDSGLTSPAQLKGGAVGLTGWADSGNTWTRALLRAAGVALADIDWTVGALTRDAPATDRIGPVTAPANVHLAAAGTGLVDDLLRGRLDAIMTPFMPPGFHHADSPLRHLIVDYPSAEAEYYRQSGFCPAIHAFAVRGAVARRWPWLPQALYAALTESKRIWLRDRTKLADASPWMLADIDATSRLFGTDWMPYGLGPNQAMLAAFCTELEAQGLSEGPVDPHLLFTANTAAAVPTAKERG
jgi:4,5-dihydroxyphthalate decarboxylase